MIITSVSEQALRKKLDSILKLGAMNHYKGKDAKTLEEAMLIIQGRGRK